jgi:hypothetical protein
MMKTATLCLTTCAAIGLSTACLAAEDMVAAEQFSGANVGFLLKGSLSNTTLTVSGPDDFHASVFSKTGAAAIDLSTLGPLEDGIYSYQLTAATNQPAKVRTLLNNGRDSKEQITPRMGMAMSGTFMVKDGKIVKPAPASKESRRDTATGGMAK